MTKRPAYQILNHGIENSQYFQGCGVSYTDFDHVVTGCGNDAVEAYNDALDSMYQSDDSEKLDKLNLPRRPRGYGITKRLSVPMKSEDTYAYVSIRYNLDR